MIPLFFNQIRIIHTNTTLNLNKEFLEKYGDSAKINEIAFKNPSRQNVYFEYKKNDK